MSVIKQLSVRNMDAETWKQIRIEALQMGVSISEIIKIAFSFWMLKNKKKE